VGTEKLLAMSRRSFGRAVLAQGLAILAPRRGRAAPGWLPGVASDSSPFLARAMAVVGERYLRAHPEEASLGTLQALVPEVRQVLLQQIACDFRDDDIVELDGWLLSRTECRHCALETLVGPREY
jgi:hypothetical protein